MLKGIPQIIVSFRVDIDGILSVSAIEKISGKTFAVEIRPTYNLQHRDIRKMFEDAMKNGKEDIKKRVLTETKIEATSVLTSAKEFASFYKTTKLNTLIDELETAISGHTEEEIKLVLDKIRLSIK